MLPDRMDLFGFLNARSTNRQVFERLCPLVKNEGFGIWLTGS